MQSALANERRLIKRRHLFFHLRVFDKSTGEKLGHAVDVTPEGMMLVSEQAIPTGVEFQLSMKLPEEGEQSRRRGVEAGSMGSSDDVNPQFYDTGFHVIKATEEHLDLMQYLVEHYGFKD